METRNKELVAVAPDGSLEVWKRFVFMGNHGWDMNNAEYDAEYEDSFFDSYWGKRSHPEFWGREVLGEL